jgi:hypothetical protein
VCTRIVIALLFVLAVALPIATQSGLLDNQAFIDPRKIVMVLPVYYLFCLPALVALVALDRMLVAIKGGQVFTSGNVRFLRVISWACFAAAVVLLAGTFVSIFFAVIALLAAFFGIILRVVKNLFAAAVELKAENDFTI